METSGFVAHQAGAILVPYPFPRGAPGGNDVAIDIVFSGMCHSDIHQINEDWGPPLFPVMPGHEIVGVATAVGSSTSKLNEGVRDDIDASIDSCQTCRYCSSGERRYCVTGDTPTNDAPERDGTTVIRIHTDPLVAAPDSRSCWDVPLAGVSTRESTREALFSYGTKSKRQRACLRPTSLAQGGIDHPS